MHDRKVIPAKVFRYLCLLTALANAGGNVVLLLFYRPICALMGAPLPKDLYSFSFVSGFSFTVGVLAFMVFLNPEKSANLLFIGAVGKAIYAFFSFYFYDRGELHPFYMIFGVWDAVFSVILFLYMLRLLSPDLTALNRGEIHARPSTRKSGKALLLYFSMTGNGTLAMGKVKEGLVRKGYTVDEKTVEPLEALFHFPFSLWEFVRIMVRAILRVPTRIKPLGIPRDHDYDLIVVESQTWFVGMSAPVEAIFQDPENRAIFEGREAAAVNVCRGLWQRPQAMLVRWLEASGATVVGARAYENPGFEPVRCFSLFFFLGAGKPGRPAFLAKILTPQHIGDEAQRELVFFGEALAERGVAPETAASGAALAPAA